MESISLGEIGVEHLEIPEGLAVVINRDELELPNAKKLFQFVHSSEIDDDNPSILVCLADYDEDSNSIKPMIGSGYNDEGVFVRNLGPVFPQLYHKSKDSLFLLVD